MLQPNFLYEPITGLQFFMGGVSKVSYSTACDVKEAIRASTGKKQSLTTSKYPTEQIECVFSDPSITYELESYLDFIKGKTVILGDGARMLASYVKVIDANSVTTPGDLISKHVSFNVQYLGDVRGRMRSAVGLTSATYSDDTAAAGGAATKSTSQWAGSYFGIWKNFLLPSGTYTIFARARDTAHIANDLILSVKDNTTGAAIINTNKTLAVGYGFYLANFTLTSAHDGHNILLQAVKGVSTPNSIYVDLLGFVASP